METICAISTAYGIGGIAVIRVSGDTAIEVVESLVGRGLTKPVQFCKIADLDDVVVTMFRAPHSFTGEDVVEVSCHGSLWVQQEVLRRLIKSGARMARAGEFTQRAFLNGKMDLSQAEAVADLIAAETEAESRLALSQLRGGLSSEIAVLRERLLNFTSLIELELDFADHEELEFADRSELKALAGEIEKHLERLTESFETGNAIKNGIPVAIVGAPNAGKSTLLNALVGEDRAIVSDIAGTTRDTVEDSLVIDGIRFRLIDTAGIRESNDTLEKLGIERSRKAMERAEVVVEVIECTKERCTMYDLCTKVGCTKVLTVLNKVDTMEEEEVKRILEEHPDYIPISAKKGEIEPLKEALKEAARNRYHAEGVAISNARHYEALQRGLEAIRRVGKGLANNLSGEWLSMDLQDCLKALGEVTGEVRNEEVLGNIFRKFCIGK